MFRSVKSLWRPLMGVLLVVVMSTGPVAADQKDGRLDALFADLLKAADAQEAAQIETRIWAIWSETQRQDINALFGQGRAAMQRGRLDEAIKLFSRIIELQPDFAEAWNKRATVLYMQHKLAQSVVDIEHTLALEPRHFGALSGMGLIFLARKDAQGALQAYERVLEINPQSASARINAEWLRKQIYKNGA